MNIINSPDIQVFDATVIWDISGSAPVISLVNLSSGPNLANINYWVEALSPTGTPIHEGAQASPDISGAWTNYQLLDPWPRPFSSIEWSGGPYTLSLFASDSIGNVYQLNFNATICRPFGNETNSTNTYGKSNTNVKVLCEQARIFFQDQTSASYKGITGTLLSSILRVVYPLDPTYTIPAPFQISDFSSALVPISYSSNNYQFLAASVYNYDLGNGSFVNIKYQQLETFSVLCNIDLMPLICEYQKLIDGIENGSCGDVQSANQKLMLINPKLSLVVMGILQPLTGVDVTGLIDEIKKIGGFDCNCCTAATGIIPQNASVIDGYTFSVVPACGDISGTVSITGNNIQIKLSDKSYVFNIGTSTGTTAFTVTPATSNCTKTYSLNINASQLATDILTIISTNAGLVNLFNSIVNTSGSSLIVDGKCIFSSAASFNYAFTLANVPINTTFALITGIQKSAVSQALNFSLNLTNLVAFQTYLNGLGLGIFVVTNPSGQNVLISSTANPNVLSNLTYTISATNFIASLTSSSAGFVRMSANQVVQNIINYLCNIDDSKIVTSQDYIITYVDENGVVQTFTVPAGTDLSDLLELILQCSTSTISNIGTLGTIDCAKLKAIFPVTNLSITGTDFIYATKGDGSCSQVKYQDAFLYMISNMTPAAKIVFCQQVMSCGAGLTCSPYTYFNVLVTNYNSACTPIMGIEYSLS